GLKANLEECLPLARSIGLAWSRDCCKGTAVYVVVQSLPDAANLHAVQDVEKFDAELGVDSLPEKESLGQRNVFTRIEGIAESANYARFVPLRKPGIGKSSRVKYRQPIVVVVVVQIERHTRIKVRTIEAVQEWIIVVRIDGLRRTASVLKRTAQLPT